MNDFINHISDPLNLAILVVSALIIIVALISVVVSIVLAIKYVKYNKIHNSVGLTGEYVARKILDDNGLENIAVKKTGSLMFGNSYSHFFKKVRLRRRTWKKDSVTSLAMAAQKSCLAILDKEGDRDMKTRIVLTPIRMFGPFMFVPLIVVGVVIDVLVFKTPTWISVAFAGAGLLFFVIAFILTIMTLKTERKAQSKAYDVLKNGNMATEEELGMMKKLFHLYNIQYINDVILSFLEILLRVLQILAAAKGGSSSSVSSNR
ncbi:MAG: zinc metallopeptidase [Bacilli bacterium]|nr:zinc metallopeptidase [Bacilli bacterium]